ncbi:MAG: hypothetical protein HYR90_02955 [Candidatus Andersenbacteria bacterium]|nr:hypothetical protein [Candidatus Andersenbacteria bacterium]MBI3251117.1 hypothetical protein [Candidatus Andersenbacteria bacterium]
MKNDKYRKARGGHSRILQLSCSNCGKELFRYQKDGPGILKRLYLDRILDYSTAANKLMCPKCNEVLGMRTIYKKENRQAYRLFTGAVSKSRS